MPHRRHRHSRRKFKDGVYQFVSSHGTPELRDSQLRRYEKVTHRKLRYMLGVDGKYHIYEKVEDGD